MDLIVLIEWKFENLAMLYNWLISWGARILVARVPAFDLVLPLSVISINFQLNELRNSLNTFHTVWIGSEWIKLNCSIAISMKLEVRWLAPRVAVVGAISSAFSVQFQSSFSAVSEQFVIKVSVKR